MRLIFTLFTSLPYAKMWSTTMPQTSFRSWDFVKHALKEYNVTGPFTEFGPIYGLLHTDLTLRT